MLFALDALSQQTVSSSTLERYAAQLPSTYSQDIALQKCGPPGCRALTPGGPGLPALPEAQPQRPTLLWHSRDGALYALALHRVRVWVDAGRLLESVERSPTPLSVQLFRPQAGGLLAQQNQPASPAALTFSVKKVLGTALQPFPIRFKGALPWTALPWSTSLPGG